MSPLQELLALLPGGATKLPTTSGSALEQAVVLIGEQPDNAWLRDDHLEGFAGAVAAELTRRYLHEGRYGPAELAAAIAVSADPRNLQLRQLHAEAAEASAGIHPQPNSPYTRRPIHPPRIRSGPASRGQARSATPRKTRMPMMVRLAAILGSTALVTSVGFAGLQLVTAGSVAAPQPAASTPLPGCFRTSTPLVSDTGRETPCNPAEAKAAADAIAGCDTSLFTPMHPSCPGNATIAWNAENCELLRISSPLHACIPDPATTATSRKAKP